MLGAAVASVSFTIASDSGMVSSTTASDSGGVSEKMLPPRRTGVSLEFGFEGG